MHLKKYNSKIHTAKNGRAERRNRHILSYSGKCQHSLSVIDRTSRPNKTCKYLESWTTWLWDLVPTAWRPSLRQTLHTAQGWSDRAVCGRRAALHRSGYWRLWLRLAWLRYLSRFTQSGKPGHEQPSREACVSTNGWRLLPTAMWQTLKTDPSSPVTSSENAALGNSLTGSSH